jgi:hypothetical protein
MCLRHIDRPLDRPISVGEKYLRTELFYLGTFFRNQTINKMANVEIDDLNLIEKFIAYPCLYNVKSKGFHNKNIVRQSWKLDLLATAAGLTKVSTLLLSTKYAFTLSKIIITKILNWEE